MTKYRIINKSILTDGLDKEEAYVTLENLRAQNPDIPYEIEEYVIEEKRMGRDPDLH
jgi:hypothetical protein